MAVPATLTLRGTMQTNIINEGGWTGTQEARESGPGSVFSITETDPDAGVEWTSVTPTNAKRKLLNLIVLCTAGAATFTPFISEGDGTTEFFREGVVAIVNATARRIVLARNTAFEMPIAQDNGNIIMMRMPENFMMAAFTLDSLGITADDNYGAPEVLVEEWLVE